MDVKQIRKKNAQTLAQEVGSWAELARRAETDPKYLSQIVSEKGTRQVGDKLARKLEQGCSKPHGWMDQDHSSQSLTPIINGQAKGVLAWDSENPLPEGEFVHIPRIDVKLSAGNGTIVYEVDDKEPLAFRVDWLRKRGLNPATLLAMGSTGDSMYPFIDEDMSILVNLADTRIVDGKVYALRYGDDIIIKRLFKRPDGGLIIHSDNSAKYPQIILSKDEVDRYISIIGKQVIRTG